MRSSRYSTDTARVSLPYGVRLFLALVLVLTALVGLDLLELRYLGSSPLQARLWSPEMDRFGDFWHYRVLLQQLHKAAFFDARDRFAYPAPCAVLYRWLYSLGPYPHVSFNLMLWGVEGMSGVWLVLALLRRRVVLWQALGLAVVLAMTSGPWHMLYDRGNIELFVYLMVALGVLAFLTGHTCWAAFCWGCAGSLKIYPLLLLAIFFRKDQWKAFLIGIATAVLLLLGSFWYVGPTIAIAAKGTLSGIRGFVGSYGAHTRFLELPIDHSLLGALKNILTLPFFPPGEDRAKLSHYYEASLLVFGPPLFLWWRKTAPARNQLGLLLILVMLLPPVSYDYTLVYTYLALGLVLCGMVDSANSGSVFRGASGYALAFAILVTPDQWIDIGGFRPNGILKTLSLLAVAYLLVRYPLERATRSAPKDPALL